MKTWVAICAIALPLIASCAGNPATDSTPTAATTTLASAALPTPDILWERPFVNKPRTYYYELYSSNGSSDWQQDVEGVLTPLVNGGFDLVRAWAPRAPSNCIGIPNPGYDNGGWLVVDLAAPDPSIEALGWIPGEPIAPRVCAVLYWWQYTFAEPPKCGIPLSLFVATTTLTLPQDGILYYMPWYMQYMSQADMLEAADTIVMEFVECGVPLRRVWVPRWQTPCDLGGHAFNGLVVQVAKENVFLVASRLERVDELEWPGILNCAVDWFWLYCFEDCPGSDRDRHPHDPLLD